MITYCKHCDVVTYPDAGEAHHKKFHEQHKRCGIPVSERLPPDDMVNVYEAVCRDNHTKRRFNDEIYWQSSFWEVPDSVSVEYWREIQPLPAPAPVEKGEGK